MHLSRNLFLVGLVLISASAKGAIDFTPTVTPYFSEGAEYANVTFKDDKRGISITLPRLWSCRGDSSHLKFTPPGSNFAEGVVQSVAAKGLIRFDEATIKSLEQQVLATLPPGSQGGVIVNQQENPVILYQNLSYEFIVSYVTLGQTFQRSIIVVSCPDQQLIFKFTAPKAVFGILNGAFRQSIYSWQWIEPVASSGAPLTASK